MRQQLRLARGALAMILVALVLQACGQEEDQRPLLYKKGTYQGQPDQKLSPEQLEALRLRAARQRI